MDISPEKYETFAIKATAPWNEHLKNRIQSELQGVASPAKRLLDAGMGTGHMLFELLNVEELKNYKFCGVDLDPAMVNFCQQKVKKTGLQEKISLCCASISDLPYADGSFALVYARSVIHHWAEPEKGLQELCRIIDSGGVVIIHEPLANPEAAALKIFNDNRAKCDVKPMSTEEKYTIEQLEAMLIKCRSVDIEYNIKIGEGIAALGCEIRITRKPL